MAHIANLGSSRQAVHAQRTIWRCLCRQLRDGQRLNRFIALRLHSRPRQQGAFLKLLMHIRIWGSPCRHCLVCLKPQRRLVTLLSSPHHIEVQASTSATCNSPSPLQEMLRPALSHSYRAVQPMSTLRQRRPAFSISTGSLSALPCSTPSPSRSTPAARDVIPSVRSRGPPHAPGPVAPRPCRR